MSVATEEKTPEVAAGRIVVILGMLCGFAPLATDMYLPAFRVMAAHFGTGEGAMEASLSVFFLGLAVGQALYGPLIDRFGRRGPLLAGIGLYIAATLLCLAVSDVRAFIALRFLQAVGGCAGMIVGRAILRDLFDASESAKALSSMMLVMTLAPIVAPILGGLIISRIGWQAVFLVMLGFGLLCGALVWRFVPETLAPERRRKDGPLEVLRAWGALLANPGFAVPALVGGLAQACMFAFITGSPFVFISLHGASAEVYGWLFAVIACALIVFAQANRLALSRWRPRTLLGFALGLNVVAGLALVASVPASSLVALMIPLWFAIGSLGLLTANAAALAMAETGEHAGGGSSLVGILQFGFAFLVSGLVAASQNGTAYPMTVAIALCGVCASGLWLAGRGAARRRSAGRG